MVLNVSISFMESAIRLVHHYPVRDDPSEPLTKGETYEVLHSLKGHKDGGKDGILPEMVKSCGSAIKAYISDLFSTVWKE